MTAVAIFRSVTGIPYVLLMLSALAAGAGHGAGYVGREVCRECHAEQDGQWQGSPHDLAMQEANDKTVLGDFSNVEFTQFDVTSRFFRKDGRFMVRTDGPDGKLHDYEIKYTFGFYPLQQYLVPFPGGRLQVLDIAWDSRPQKEGGQRWFHLHPGEKDKRRSCAALDRPQSQLELHVCGLSFHQPEKEL